MEHMDQKEQVGKEEFERYIQEVYNAGFSAGFSNADFFLCHNPESGDIKYIMTRMGCIGIVAKNEDKYIGAFNSISHGTIIQETSDITTIESETEEECAKNLVDLHIKHFNLYVEKKKQQTI